MWSPASIATALVPVPGWENSMAHSRIWGVYQYIPCLHGSLQKQGFNGISIFLVKQHFTYTIYRCDLILISVLFPGSTKQNIDQNPTEQIQLLPRNQIILNPDRPVRRISKPKRRRPGTRSELASMKAL